MPAWLRIELLTPDQAGEHEAAWRDLASRALVPNLFYEPDIALPAATHLLQGQGPRLLLAWDQRALPVNRLILCAPLILPSFGMGEAKLWTHEQLPSSAPLIDREEADAAIDALLEALRHGPARATALRLPSFEEEGLFADLIRRSAARLRRRILRLEQPRRAAPDPISEDAPPGQIRTVTARSPRRVREAVEHYLAIEATGPAGETGEALLLSPQNSAFLRVVTRSLAKRRACHVDLHLSQRRPIGAAIFLHSDGGEIAWKRAGSGAPAGACQGSAASARACGQAAADWLIPARSGRSPAMLALAARDALSSRLRQLVRRAVREA